MAGDEKPSPRDLFREAGGEYAVAEIQWPITQDQVRSWCEKRERILRAGYPGHVLPERMQEQLDRIPTDDVNLWRRYQLLITLIAEKQHRRDDAGQDRQIAARLLLSREPVPVRIGSRVVEITARSYASMVALFRHEETLRLLGDALDHLEQKAGEVRADVERGRRSWLSGWMERWRLHWLRRDIEHEWQRQVRGILANALSADGKAATPDDAPEWWYEVGEDEVRLLVGIFEAGHRRLMRMRPATSETVDTEDSKENPFGWDGVLRTLEARKRLPPMALDDVDFFRLLAAEMMGAGEGTSSADAEDLFAA